MKYSDTLLPNQRLLKKFFSDKDYKIYMNNFKNFRYIEPNKKFKLIKHNKVNHLIMVLTLFLYSSFLFDQNTQPKIF